MDKINFAPQFIDVIKLGKKTQTRRPIKPLKDFSFVNHKIFDCRYGGVGSRLLINETDICIQITSIRIEELQHISEEDAIKEGMNNGIFERLSTAFLYMWDRIYKGTTYSAGINPWVWVIEFKKLKGCDCERP